MNDKIISALNWRYAVQTFDTNKKVSDEDFSTIMEAARLSPSAFGVEPWKFIVVKDPQIRQRLHDEASPQPKVMEGSHFVVIAKRTDARATLADQRVARVAKAQGVPEETLEGMRTMLDGAIKSKDDVQLDAWVSRQLYIPLGVMIEAAALLGVDAGPMEGFNNQKFDEILGLKDHNLASVVAIAFGYRGNDSAADRPKSRRSVDDAIMTI